MSQELTKENEDDLLIKLLKKLNINIDCSLDQSSKKSLDLSLAIDKIYVSMNTKNEIIQLQATQACRMIVSRKKNPPIDEVISKGIVSLCIEFLKSQYSSKLQFEACWVITNVASGTSEQTQYVINQGAVPLLVELLKSSSTDVLEMAVWALGNIAADGPVARDLVLQEGTLPLLGQLKTPKSLVSLARITAWTLTKIYRYENSAPPFQTVNDALPLLKRLLDYSDKEVIGDTSLALSYFSDGSDEHIQALIECGIIPKLIDLLDSAEVRVLSLVLQILGSITYGNDSQTDTVVNYGALPFLRDLLHHKEVNINKRAAWIISNITAGNVEQIQQVIDADIITPLVQVMQKDDSGVQKEAAWVISNMTINGTGPQIAYLFDKKILEPFCDLLMLSDEKCVLAMLDGIKRILTTAEIIDEVDRIALIIKGVGGLNNLRTLQKHENVEISQKAASIINLYFSETNCDIFPTKNTEDQLEHQTVTSKDNFEFEVQDIYAPY